MGDDLQTKLQTAGRGRVVVSHAVGASNDGRFALVKAAMFGGTIETYALPAALACWLIDRIAQAIDARAIRDRRSEAAAGSPEAQQIALFGATRPEIANADWATPHLVAEIRAHAFGNALGLLIIANGTETILILPDQVAILLHESLTLAATYLIDLAHPPRSHSDH